MPTGLANYKSRRDDTERDTRVGSHVQERPADIEIVMSIAHE